MATNINEDIATVDIGSQEIMNYPFIHMTGHGNVVISDQEIQNLRNYLMAGGFLHIDDNYGMDKYIRPQLKRVFPELELLELPFDHPIYHQKYNFQNGLPKIHEHDGKPPQGFGLIYEGRLVVFYTFECDLGDGWEDPSVHGDSEPTRQKPCKWEPTSCNTFLRQSSNLIIDPGYVTHGQIIQYICKVKDLYTSFILFKPLH